MKKTHQLHHMILYSILMITTHLQMTDASWIGDECCNFAIEDRCRQSCNKKIRSIDGITENCSIQLEDEFWDCIFRHKTRNRCCRRDKNLSKDCMRKCDEAFQSPSGPTLHAINNLEKLCTDKMASCIKSYRKKVKSTQSNFCCQKATDENCRLSCLEIYQDESDASEIAIKLTKACGSPILYKPFWACLMTGENDKVETPKSPFVAQLQCCSKATSKNCRLECLELYPSVNPDHERWKVFEDVCRNSPDEYELRHCLAEIQAPCKVGCSGLKFCSNFNNRPFSLFRSCNLKNDEKAKQLYETWKTKGDIRIPSFLNIPFLPIDTCESEKWKAIACTIHIQPCSSYTGEFNICNSDCLHLMDKCVDHRKLGKKINIHDVCNRLTSNYESSTCIHLSTYTKPAEIIVTEAPYSAPCNATSCRKNEVCLINRNQCAENASCSKHLCVPGCPLSSGSSMIVPHGHLIRVPQSTQDNCYQLAVCDANNSEFPKTHLFQSTVCEKYHRKSCKVNGRIKLHSEIFDVDCNFCVCFNGKAICTKKICRSSNMCDCSVPHCEEKEESCDLECLAWCETKFGSQITCDHDPCKHYEKCVTTPRVCLTYPGGRCQQYECIPRQKKCKKLLKNAILQHEGNLFENPIHRYKKYENIISSSVFFSNMKILKTPHQVCDINNDKYEDICSWVDHSKFAYSKKCNQDCSSEEQKPVCGYDNVTYESVCSARLAKQLIQYKGPCVKNCTDIKCYSNVSSGCEKVLPPGSCCPICAGMFRVLFSREIMKNYTEQIWKGPVSLDDVITQLERFVNIFECRMFGYLTVDDDVTILITSLNQQKFSRVLIKSCVSEAERITILINKRHPKLTSDVVLSSLVGSRLYKVSLQNSTPKLRPNFFVFVGILFIFYFYSK